MLETQEEPEIERPATSAESPQFTLQHRIYAWYCRLPHPHLITLGFAIALAIAAGAIGTSIGDFSSLGYAGIFLVCTFGSASILCPIPFVPVIFIGGAILNPLAVGVIAGLGVTTGKVVGYLIGYSATDLVERRAVFGKVHSLMERHGGLVIVVAAAIPSPFFDVVGAVAGAMRYPMPKFFLYCFIGQTIKSLVYAYSGDFGTANMSHIYRRYLHRPGWPEL